MPICRQLEKERNYSRLSISWVNLRLDKGHYTAAAVSSKEISIQNITRQCWAIYATWFGLRSTPRRLLYIIIVTPTNLLADWWAKFGERDVLCLNFTGHISYIKCKDYISSTYYYIRYIPTPCRYIRRG